MRDMCRLQDLNALDGKASAPPNSSNHAGRSVDVPGRSCRTRAGYASLCGLYQVRSHHSGQSVAIMIQKVTLAHVAALLALWLLFQPAIAQQSGLPKPSRTAFKCTVAGKVTYSDEPCVGAERVDLQPSRGLDKSTGKELVGADVRREHNREQIAEAVRPLTGKSNEQFETHARRFKLSAAAQRECASLDTNIPRAESEERVTAAEGRESVQRRLFSLRARFRQLGC